MWSVTKSLKTALKPLFWAIFVLSALGYVFSWIAQNWAGVVPCKLCLAQRYVYVALLSVSLAGCLTNRTEYCRKILLFIISIGLLVAAYHSLTYWGVIKTKCSFSASDLGDLENFRRGLAVNPTCIEKMFLFLGIPAPLWNFLLFLAFVAALFWYAKMGKFLKYISRPFT